MFRQYIKVENQPNLVRDKASGAILNINPEALSGYKKERETRLKMSQLVEDYQHIKEEQDRIKQSVDEINIKLDLLIETLGKNKCQ